MKNIIYLLNDSRQIYVARHVIIDRLALFESIKKKRKKKIKIILWETKKQTKQLYP